MGYADVGGVRRASLWTGTASSWIDLNPSGSTQSEAFGVSEGLQVGYALIGNVRRASLWSGSAGSRIDLAAFVPPEFISTVALAVAADNSGAYVVGYGVNGTTNRFEALLWTQRYLDSDGDGLLDDWENSGIPYTKADGTQGRYILPGANWLKKDIYVEVDAMSGFSLDAAAIPKLQAAFAAAPVRNPSGSGDGITIHVVPDETNLILPSPWPTDGCWPLDFATRRAASFGSPSERADPARLAAKAKAYRYCIIADRASPKNIGGCGQTPGDNFVVFFGSGVYDAEAQAAVFMHELGHNLGLDHGGSDGVNGKPNYPSIMNYTLSYRAPWNDRFWRLDYSRLGPPGLADLNESSLDERVGIGAVGGEYRDFRMPFGVNDSTGRVIRYVRLDGSRTDFGDTAGTGFQDGLFSASVRQDLNYALVVPPGSGVSLPIDPSPGEPLRAFDDWSRVAGGLPLAARLGPSAPAPRYPSGELTGEARTWISLNFPIPPGPAPCPADIAASDGTPGPDSAVNNGDFQCFFSSFFNATCPACGSPTTTACNPADIAQADASPGSDGCVNNGDFQLFFSAFFTGCP